MRRFCRVFSTKALVTPRVGVTVTILRDSPSSALIGSSREVLLVKRANSPFKDFWALPGGSVEAGEALRQAAIREVKEECGIDIEPFEPFYATDSIVTESQLKAIEKAEEPAVREKPETEKISSPPTTPIVPAPVDRIAFHFALVHFLSHSVSSSDLTSLSPGGDALACRWFSLVELEEISKLSVDARAREGRDRVVPNVLDVVQRGAMWQEILTAEE